MTTIWTLIVFLISVEGFEKPFHYQEFDTEALCISKGTHFLRFSNRTTSSYPHLRYECQEGYY